MTVEELIADLQTYPPHMPVYAEGCDCVNPVCGTGVLSSHDPRGPARSELWILSTGFFRGREITLREVRWRPEDEERLQ